MGGGGRPCPPRKIAVAAGKYEGPAGNCRPFAFSVLVLWGTTGGSDLLGLSAQPAVPVRRAGLAGRGERISAWPPASLNMSFFKFGAQSDAVKAAGVRCRRLVSRLLRHPLPLHLPLR